jgi:hypothetical protein
MAPNAHIAALLDQLEAQLPDMVEDNPRPADFWPVFVAVADPIEEAAGSGQDLRYIASRIEGMLGRYGMRIANVEIEDEDDGDDVA